MIDRMKLPMHFFTSSITTIPVTIAITIDAIAATNEEIENVRTADNYITEKYSTHFNSRPKLVV